MKRLLSRDIMSAVSAKSAPWMFQTLCDNIRSSSPKEDWIRVMKFLAECVIWEAFQQLALAAVCQYPTLDPPDYCSDRFELDSSFELDVELIE